MEALFKYDTSDIKSFVQENLECLDAASRNLFLETALRTKFGQGYKATNSYITAYEQLKPKKAATTATAGDGDGVLFKLPSEWQSEELLAYLQVQNNKKYKNYTASDVEELIGMIQ